MTPVSPATLDNLRDRCARSDALLANLACRLADGEPASGLLQELELIWVDAPPVDPLPPDVRAALARTQAAIAAAVGAGSRWLTTAADQLQHLARGRQMMTAYSTFEDR
jgi:hypothetical protein